MKRLCLLMLMVTTLCRINFVQTNASCPPIDRVILNFEAPGFEPGRMVWVLAIPTELRVSCGDSCQLTAAQKQPIIDWIRTSAYSGFLREMLASIPGLKVVGMQALNYSQGSQGPDRCSFILS